MKGKRFVQVWAVLALLVSLGIGVGGASSAKDELEAEAAAGTAFTYQGQLRDGSGPVNATCDLQFKLWDASGGGAQVGGTVLLEDVVLADGLFTARLDFGAAAFRGQARYLEVAASCPAGSAFVPLPRQELTGSPYALWALGAPWTGLVGVPADLADGDQDTTYTPGTGLSLNSGQFSVNFGGGGTAVTASRSDHSHAGAYWQLGGNAGTTPGTNYLGTSDNAALEIKVNGARALRIEPGSSPNLLGGYSGNLLTAGVTGATISGGGSSGNANRVTDSYGTVSGGTFNQAGDGAGTTSDHSSSTVGGGWHNTASGGFATVGGGYDNTASGMVSTVAGGDTNYATNEGSTVSGGFSNTVTGIAATICGGNNNTASGERATVGGGWLSYAGGSRSTVGGGYGNTASAGYATIGGGGENSASGEYATIGGGAYNTASGIAAVIAGGGGYHDFLENLDNVASGNWTAIGGGGLNTAQGEFATVGGGFLNNASGESSMVGGGQVNSASGEYATIGGGYSNEALDYYDTVGGGASNTASGDRAVIGGGGNNTASASWATVGGGAYNSASAILTTIGGGGWDVGNPLLGNRATDSYGTVGGGHNNQAGDDADPTNDRPYATVGGGRDNVASGTSSVVAGGDTNTASGWRSMVPGGVGNVAAGDHSFAAGRRAMANHGGAFVWADGLDVDFASTNSNTFRVRATNGAEFVANNAGYGLIAANNGAGDGMRAMTNSSAGTNWAAVYAVSNGTSPAVYANSAGTYSGYFMDNIYVDGNCVGCTTAFVAVNAGSRSLEAGDLVSVLGVTDPLSGTAGPLLTVQMASAQGPGVIGIVQSKATLSTSERGEQALQSAEKAGGRAARGEYLFIVVQGIAYVKADARLGAINPGDRLTAAAVPGHARSIKTVMVEGVALSEGAPVVGIALEALAEGTGLIPVLVSLQ